MASRQHVPVYDLYGLLNVSPNASEVTIREAYEGIIKKSQPDTPGNAVTIAYTLLTNPPKRAQYDRDRLEYLYNHFADHDSFPSATSPTPSEANNRDEHIRLYAANLATRVHDPLGEKKRAISLRLARTKEELDEFNEKSSPHRQDWATSPNTILRMAGNALRQIVVCAEEDICMLEDELGRLNGVLAPRDTDGPAGRVTSGQYGSELNFGIVVGDGAGGEKQKKMYGILAAANGRAPSIPRSPTMPVRPLSASRLGVTGDDSGGRGGDSSGSEGVGETELNILADDRVNQFLSGPSTTVASTIVTRSDNLISTSVNNKNNRQQHVAARHQPRLQSFRMYARDFSSHGGSARNTRKTNTNSPSPSTLEKAFPPRPIGMGLIEWQALHGTIPATMDEQTAPVSELATKDDFKLPHFPPLRINVHGDHANQAHFTRKSKAAATPTTTGFAPLPNGSNGVEDGGNFGFHVSKPSERAVIPPPVNYPARSAGIKDFQVRVWSAAKAAKLNGGDGGAPHPEVELALADVKAQGQNGECGQQHAGVPGTVPISAVRPKTAGGPIASGRNISQGKNPKNAVEAPIFRRNKSGMKPISAGDEAPKNGCPPGADLDDPFR